MLRTIEVTSTDWEEVSRAIREAEDLLRCRGCQFENGENVAYADALLALRRYYLKDIEKKLKGVAASVFFRCSPNPYSSAELVVTVGRRKLKIFDQFYDTFSNWRRPSLCRVYSAQSLEATRRAIQEIKVVG